MGTDMHYEVWLYVFSSFLINRTVQADKSGDLDMAEVFKLERFVSVVRREYVESYERRSPPTVTQIQLKNTISAHGNV